MKRIRTLTAVAAGIAGAAVILTGCSGGGLLDQGDSTPGASGDALTIGVSYPTSNSPFWQRYIDFIEDGGDQLGVTINAVAAEDDEQQQVSDVQNLISQGVDGLIITPTSTAVAPQLLTMAADADVKVVVTDRYPGYDSGTDGEADYVGFIGPNDEQAGEGIGAALIASGADQILGLGGTPGTSVAEGRKTGLENAIIDGGTLVQYENAGDSQEVGLATFESLLQAYPTGSANGVWCFNDNLCLGAIKAAQNADRADEFKFGGMDLSPDAITAIEDGSYFVSFGGHWLQGGFGLVMLYDALNDIDPANPIVKLDLLEVNAENVAAFKDQYIDNPPVYDFTELSKVTNADATGAFEITLK